MLHCRLLYITASIILYNTKIIRNPAIAWIAAIDHPLHDHLATLYIIDLNLSLVPDRNTSTCEIWCVH
jgi:hypothetical protein